MAAAIAETTRKTNEHLIKEFFLFTRESINGKGRPPGGQEGLLEPIGAPFFFHFF